MFVITADQIDSRSTADRAPATLADLNDLVSSLALTPARFAGDELQFVTESPSVALDVVLRLIRSDGWSVGLGLGGVRTPLPTDPAAATGPAFIRARTAVEAAKRSPTRFALVGGGDASMDGGARTANGDELGALVDLLLVLRARRSEEGWAVCDLLDTGMTQAAAAESLGVTPQAVSLRVRAAGWRIESRARPGLVVLLEAADTATSAEDSASDA